MLSIFDSLRDMTTVSVCVRMLLAVCCGGIVGLEREIKRRPAGFRTHILICLGAAMTTMTSQYLYLVMGLYTDIARLGAQVVAGIGFIGAGTIIVTRRQRVKGLTTAAGLWASAIIGLSAGAGFFEGAILTTALLMLAELVFAKLEYRLRESAPEANFYIEYVNSTTMDQILRFFRDQKLKVLNIEITRSTGNDTHNACAIFSLMMNKHCSAEQALSKISSMEGVVIAEEL